MTKNNVVALVSSRHINYDKMMTDMMTKALNLTNYALLWIKSLYPQ